MSSHLSDFFCQKTILLTGSTGFVGKCILEKLLRSCPHIQRIYVLLRPKAGKTASKRLNQLFEDSIFDSLKDKNCFEKVYPICGDISLEELALSPLERQLVCDEIQVIINCAATIRFDEPLRRALQLNVGSAQRILRLAQRCLQLEALVHVSTAYCTRDRQLVLEEIPKENYSPNQLLSASEWMSDQMLEELTKHLLRGRPSTYHLTKALAEQLLSEGVISGGHNIPLAIVRPSIVVGSWREPSNGWIDNYNGIAGYLVASGKGILRSLHCKEELICDIIPVDLVVNTVLASIRQIYGKRDSNSIPFIVNCCSYPLNGITWKDIKELSLKPLINFPSKEIFLPPNTTFHSNYYAHQIHVLLAHTIPSFVVDLLFRACGLQPILTQVYAKLWRAMTALETFTLNEWRFQNSNQILLINGLSEEDKQMFPLDVSLIDWKEYFNDFVKGIRFFLLKENPKTISSANHKLQNLQMSISAVKVILISLFVWKLKNKLKL